MSTTTTEMQIVNTSLLTQKFNERKARVSKASEFAKKLPATIASDDEDEKVMSFIGKLQTLSKALNEERTPITKKFDEIRSYFTQSEKEVDELVKSLSDRRNKYITVKAAKIKAANEAAQALRFKAEELIDLSKDIEIQIRAFVIGLVEKKKERVLAALKTVTKVNQAEILEKIQGMSVDLDPVFYGSFEPSVKSKYGNDVTALNAKALTELESEMLTHYRKDLDTFKAECIMQINTLATMSKEEKAEAIEAKETEIKVEASTALEVAEVHLEHQNEAAKAEQAFTSVAESFDNSIPANRQSFEIAVLNNAGWIAINTFWLTVLAANFTGNFETKTLKSMKGDLEKYAKDTGTKLVSPNVTYTEKFTAINKS